jgi:transposase InsO family protein
MRLKPPPCRANPEWGYRRVHGELAALGIKVAASTVWSILKEHGIPPVPERGHTTRAALLRSQAEAILAADFFETKTLTGATLTVPAVIEQATRRVRILGATAHPTADWLTQLTRNHAMDLQDSGTQIKYLIRDRDVRHPAGFDAVLADEGIEIVRTGVRTPRINAIVERWIRSCRTELLDRTLIWNQTHLLHALRAYETYVNQHRPTAPLPPPHPYARSQNRSNTTNSSTSTPTHATASPASSTRTNMPRDQHGRSSRHLQRLRSTAHAVAPSFGVCLPAQAASHRILSFSYVVLCGIGDMRVDPALDGTTAW